MIYLPDVNIWLALVVAFHLHRDIAKTWFDKNPAGTFAFCRVTEMGILRLLTNSKVMQHRVLTPAQAWETRDAFFNDERVRFVPEPEGLIEPWRATSEMRKIGSNFWTDAYLAAFRESAATLLSPLIAASSSTMHARSTF